ncbi:hypothetical protein GYA49_00945 [Candidatus Beckwithbacteria bacterium]|nr:hypothetical protein [Candidatus Beckwithbacteria bacterium]
MDQNIKFPTLEEIKTFLSNYGWNYKETNADGKTVLLSPLTLEGKAKAILLSFRTEGEFVMVNSVGLLKQVPANYCQSLLDLNDKLKLTKIFITKQSEPGKIDADMGFELWDGAWNQDTFFAFLDMLTLGIHKVLNTLDYEKVPYKTSFVTYI